MDCIFSNTGGGHSVFDYYSITHIIWFIALTTIFAPIFKKKVWLAMLALGFVWEVFEFWVVDNIPDFPFAGREEFLNKIIGDPICDFLGFLIAWVCLNSIRRNNKNGL